MQSSSHCSNFFWKFANEFIMCEVLIFAITNLLINQKMNVCLMPNKKIYITDRCISCLLFHIIAMSIKILTSNNSFVFSAITMIQKAAHFAMYLLCYDLTLIYLLRWKSIALRSMNFSLFLIVNVNVFYFDAIDKAIYCLLIKHF